MSALPPKADMCSALADVRFGPKADIRASRIWRVFTASSGSFNPRVDFAAKHPKVDWFGKKPHNHATPRFALNHQRCHRRHQDQILRWWRARDISQTKQLLSFNSTNSSHQPNT